MHDVGNERRFVFLIPALVALASLVLARGSLLPDEAALVPRRTIGCSLCRAILYTAYVVSGPLARLPFLADVHAHVLRQRSGWQRPAASCSVARVSWRRGRGSPPLRRGACGRPARGHGAGRRRSRPGTSPSSATGRSHRTYKNYEASLALGRALPPGTLVQGKLANGLALENRDPADLHRPRVRQLRRPESSDGMCDIF